MRSYLYSVCGLGLFAGAVLLDLPAHGRDAAPTAVTNAPFATNSAAADSTNNDEADKAWKLVTRFTQAPMPPPEWSTKPPTREEVDKFNLDTLHKGMDLARDFYTRYPSHPKAAMAQKIELDMLSIATEQFHDTDLAPRLAALTAKRLSDPNVSEEDKFNLRVDPLVPLMRKLPATADEVEKQVLALQKDFPKRPEVYKIMLMVMSHSDGAQLEAWAKRILDSPAPDEIKSGAKLTLRAATVQKLIAGLPGTADELDKNVRALPKDFPGSSDGYRLMLFSMARMEPARAAALAKEIQAGDAPDDVKEKAKMVLRVGALEKLIAGFPQTADEFLKGIHEFEKDYPQNPNAYNLLFNAFQKSEGAQARVIGAELLASPIEKVIKSEVEAVLAQMDYIGKPLDIQYTAVDGRQVDVARMKGKVILVDFWGTWCGVCMQKLPGLQETYTKLHGKGFEIVGIDCDDEKDTLLQTVKSKGIPWPQYHEDTAGPNKFAAQYGIHMFPTMWVVDKKGVVRYVNASDGLEDKVTKLLAE